MDSPAHLYSFNQVTFHWISFTAIVFKKPALRQISSIISLSQSINPVQPELKLPLLLQSPSGPVGGIFRKLACRHVAEEERQHVVVQQDLQCFCELGKNVALISFSYIIHTGQSDTRYRSQGESFSLHTWYRVQTEEGHFRISSQANLLASMYLSAL